MRVPRLLVPGSASSPLVVVRSGFWNFNGIGFFDGQEALVIDPGIYPEDIALLGAAVRSRALKDQTRTIEHVVITHSHHDHIRGWRSFPGAQVSMPRVAARKDSTARGNILAAKKGIDDRLGISDPNFEYPKPDHTFESETTLKVGSEEVVVFALFGHSNCCSVVWIPSLRTLCTADYLVTPGVPYCRWQAKAFDEALEWLRLFCREQEIQTVWPAHNAPLESPQAISKAIELEQGYMQTLRDACAQAIAEGKERKDVIRTSAIAARTYRGTDTKASRLQDLDNARRVLEELSST